jgi:hypothetical protein
MVTLFKATQIKPPNGNSQRKKKKGQNLQGYGAQTAREERYQSPYGEASDENDL